MTRVSVVPRTVVPNAVENEQSSALSAVCSRGPGKVVGPVVKVGFAVVVLDAEVAGSVVLDAVVDDDAPAEVGGAGIDEEPAVTVELDVSLRPGSALSLQAPTPRAITAAPRITPSVLMGRSHHVEATDQRRTSGIARES